MKQSMRISILAILCALMLLPIAAWAETYDLGDTDMTIEVDDSRWYVFTRDNLENNPELAEFGISESEVYDDLCRLEAYLDAVLLYTDGNYKELFVFKTSMPEDSLVNMSNYSNEELEEVAESMADEHGVDDYSIYENDYKFLRFDYFEEETDCYIYAFVTVVNRDIYTLKFQSSTPFSDAQYEEFDRIVDSVHFDVDTSMKEPTALRINWPYVIASVVVAGIVGGILGLVGSSKKKKAANTWQNSSGYDQQSYNGYNQQGYGGYNQQSYNGYNQPSDNRYFQPNDRR